MKGFYFFHACSLMVVAGHLFYSRLYFMLSGRLPLSFSLTAEFVAIAYGMYLTMHLFFLSDSVQATCMTNPYRVVMV